MQIPHRQVYDGYIYCPHSLYIPTRHHLIRLSFLTSILWRSVITISPPEVKPVYLFRNVMSSWILITSDHSFSVKPHTTPPPPPTHTHTLPWAQRYGSTARSMLSQQSANLPPSAQTLSHPICLHRQIHSRQAHHKATNQLAMDDHERSSDCMYLRMGMFDLA